MINKGLETTQHLMLLQVSCVSILNVSIARNVALYSAQCLRSVNYIDSYKCSFSNSRYAP